MSIRLTILKEMQAVADEQQKPLKPLSDDTPLTETGLDSLGYALLVARLEDITGLDPFASISGSEFPTTLGQLIGFYETAAV